MELRRPVGPVTQTDEGIPYMSITWAACFRMAVAHAVTLFVVGIILGAIFL